MTDSESSNAQIAGFDRLANLFIEMGVFVSPSEFHGLLCGQLAQGRTNSEADWLRDVAGYLERERIEDAECKRALLDIYSATEQQMQGSGFELELLLPDDDAELAQRAESIGLWCQGFLAGFGGSRLKELSEEARESLSDFTQIAQIERDELEDSEDNEEDLMQVVEYVRMAAILIYSEVMGGNQEDSDEQPRSLH